MSETVFSKIIAGEIPSRKVYEDDDVLAFLDIAPATEGHTIVIPKKPARNLLDISAEDLAKVHAVVQQLANEYTDKLGAEGFTVMNYCEEVGQQEIFHYHVHLVPRYADDGVNLGHTPSADAEAKLDETHKKLTS